MHYFRLLKAPQVMREDGRYVIKLVFTITTDLGDSFLWPVENLPLHKFGIQVIATVTSGDGSSSWLLSDPGRLFWKHGMRVAKPTLEFPYSIKRAMDAGREVELCVRPATSDHSADSAGRILAPPSETILYQEDLHKRGMVMPAWSSLRTRNDGDQVSKRQIYLGMPADGSGYLELEEEIGESIARHIWDAGVVAFCTIAGIGTLPDYQPSQHACMKALHNTINSRPSLRVLELGCGVGILGLGLAAAYPKLRTDPSARCTIMMTDLPEAESRARANIRLNNKGEMDPPAKVLYENLDWEEGRKGKFGQQVSSQAWDLVMLSDCTYNVDMLPALVETLTALHSSNLNHISPGERFRTKVFLATKPRHDSEMALFELLDKNGWITVHEQILWKPLLGAMPQAIRMYLFQKTGSKKAGTS